MVADDSGQIAGQPRKVNCENRHITHVIAANQLIPIPDNHINTRSEFPNCVNPAFLA